MSATVLMWMSVVSLVVGTGVHRLARVRKLPLAVADGFVVIAVCGLVLIHILPEALRVGGWWALGAAAVGVAFPYFFEARKPLQQVPPLLMVIAVVGLCVHLFLDGAAIGGGAHATHASHHGQSNALGVAVVLHRFPVGVSLWLFARPDHRGTDVLRLTGIVLLATVAGFVLGSKVLAVVPPVVVASFQALVAGSLLHIVMETRTSTSGRGQRVGAALGGALAVVLVALLGSTHLDFDPSGPAISFTRTLVRLAALVAPWLIAGYAAAALAHALLPPGWRTVLLRGRLTGPFRGAAVGVLRPVTMCAAPHTYESLDEQGVLPAANVALFVVIGTLAVPAIAITWPLLGPSFTLARIAAGLLLAVIAGYVLMWARSHPPVHPNGAEHAHEPATWRERLADGVSFGFGELVDHTAPWVIVGLVFAAVLEPMFAHDTLAVVPSSLQIPLASIAALPFYVCATGGTPLVLLLMHKGLSAGAALVLLLCGPLLSMQILRVLWHLHGARVVAVYALVIIAFSVASGFAIEALPVTLKPFDLHAYEPTAFSILCLAVVTTLFLWTYVRQGPRRFLELAFAPHGHAHEHGELHEHA